MSAWFIRLRVVLFMFCLSGCGVDDSASLIPEASPPMDSLSTNDALRIDPETGIPYAITFQHPVPGFDTSDYGFGFGTENRWFCLSSVDGQCASYGYHLGRDTLVAESPFGTDVFAPADGIVRITTDLTFGGYGADSSRNPNYNGCVLVLEHLLANGEAVTTLLGHLSCESRTPYNEVTHEGNPARGTIVRRGQYVGHIGHYWHGATQSTDWHHVHWAMRKGRFTPTTNVKADVLSYVLGYAPLTEFTRDPYSGALVHHIWLDPFLVVAANGDPVLQAAAGVRHHPSGTLLQDSMGEYWFVETETEIVSVPWDVVDSDRYDTMSAVLVSDEEMGCYTRGRPRESLGHVTLYQRPGTRTVVMAYDASWTRYDAIRLEALLSWGYELSEVGSHASTTFFEASYESMGFRRLRPGSLVKANEETEVAIVTADQHRLPIASGDVFEKAGYQWERIISLPRAVLTDVAGERLSDTLTLEDIHQCAVPAPCPDGERSCGGGGSSEICIPGVSIACTCLDESHGAQVCADDGLGFLACVCDPPIPVPVPLEEPLPVSDPISVPASEDPSQPEEALPMDMPIVPDAGSTTSVVDAPSDTPLHLLFQSPVSGPLSIQGWWQGSGGTRSWGLITECVDHDTTDTVLECDLPVPTGASPFEFQIYLPDGRYWGDHACDSGGCNQPLGTLVLSKSGTSVGYTFEPNHSGAPYYNGHVTSVP